MSRVLRRALTATAILAAVATAVSALGFSGRLAALPPDESRPNIVYLVVDDLDVDSARTMPVLRRQIIDEGMSLRRFFTGYPLCCPSRTTVLRGQHAHNTGVLGNTPAFSFPNFRASRMERSTVATWLQDGGYRTALMGKYMNHYPDTAPADYVPPGWTDWRASVRGGAGGFDYVLNENGRLRWYGEDEEDYFTDVLADAATEFIGADDDKPFFLYLSPHAPHSPATPAPRHADMFDDERAPRPTSFDEADLSDKPPWIRALPPLSLRDEADLDELHRQRLRSMQAVDEMLDAVIDALAERGELDNTYVVFTSDNGYTLGTHRIGPGKNSLYEEDIRVPFYVRGPGVPAGSEVPHLSANVDLASTFADIADVSPAAFVDGRSLLPLWQGEGPEESRWRKAVLLEHESSRADEEATILAESETAAFDRALAELPKPGRPIRSTGSEVARPAVPSFRGVRTDRYVYAEYATGARELYDLHTDPQQLRNIAATADEDLLDRVSGTLAALRNCQAAECRAAEEEVG